MLRLLRNRNYSLLWLANATAVLGDVLFSVGVMVTIYERTGSAFQTMGVMVASLLPPLLLGPVAGVYVDRVPRTWVLVGMGLIRAALMGLLLVRAVQPTTSVWLIYSVVAGLAAAKTFFDPARQAAIPTTVDKLELVLANSLLMTTTQAAYALGYGFGGVLILSLGLRPLIQIVIIAFLLSALTASQLRLPMPRHQRSKDSRWLGTDIRSGFHYIHRHSLVRSLLTMEVLEHIPHGIWTAALMLAFTIQALGGDATWWGWQNASYYAGMLAGAILAAMTAGRLTRVPGKAIILAASASAILTLLYALSPSLSFAVLLAFMFGPIMAVRDLSQEALLQAEVNPGTLGRVFATRNMGVSLTFMLAAPLFAWGADHLPVRWIYLLGSFLYFLTALYAGTNRAIRQSRITNT